MVKNLPAKQGMQVPSLGWEAPLEKGKAIHSSILARKLSRTEEPGRLQSIVLDMTEATEHVDAVFVELKIIHRQLQNRILFT